MKSKSLHIPLTERQAWLLATFTAAYMARGFDAPTAMKTAESAAELFEKRYTVAQSKSTPIL